MRSVIGLLERNGFCQVDKHGDEVDTFGHSSTDNRFNDANLGERFVWGKKIDEMVKRGEDPRRLTDPKAVRKRKVFHRSPVAPTCCPPTMPSIFDSSCAAARAEGRDL